MIIQLTDWLYQGDWASIYKGEYEAYRIGVIVRVSDLIELEKSTSRGLFPIENINYLWCPFGDRGEGLTRKQLEVMTHFAWKFGPDGILVHCQSGQNRSSVVCALLLKEIGPMTEEDACGLVLKRNSMANVQKELVDTVKDLVHVDLKWLL